MEGKTDDTINEQSDQQPTDLNSTEGAPGYTEAVMHRSVLDVVFGQTGVMAIISPLNGVLVCAALWTPIDHGRLLIWIGALVAAMVVRYGAVAAFRRHGRGATIRVWDSVFGGSLVLTSLIWGAGAFFILPTSSAFHETVVYVFLIAMAGGTALSYSALKSAAIASLVLILGPVTVKFFVTPDIAFRAMAAGGVVLIILGSVGILRLGSFIRRSFEYSHKLDAALQTAEHLARVDDLTGISNRRAFYEMGDYLILQARRIKYPLSILLIDVDRFKQINDTYGHSAGDTVLRTLATCMKQSCRSVDVVGRLGGDEFAILLPGNNLNEAVAYATRLRQTFSECDELIHEIGANVTCSIGVAALEGDMHLDRLIHVADTALYSSKRKGRDRISH